MPDGPIKQNMPAYYRRNNVAHLKWFEVKIFRKKIQKIGYLGPAILLCEGAKQVQRRVTEYV